MAALPGVEDDDILKTVSTPAYSLLSGEGNSQCTGDAVQFCFFCAFQPDDDESNLINGADHPQGLRSLVRAMISQRKEVAVIIRKVREAYDSTVRSEVTWHNPDTGETIEAPEWDEQVIQRHLLHSNEFPDLFEDSIERVFHNVIVRQNEHMVDSSTGVPQPEQLELFLKTVKALSQYKESRRRLTTTGPKLSDRGVGKKSR